MRTQARSRRLWQDEAGNISVEFAFIGVVLLMTTLGVVEAGRALYMNHKLTTAVGGTTRLVQMRAPSEAIIDSVSSRFSAGEQANLAVDVDPNFILNGVTYTRIDARYALPLIMPNFNLFPSSPYTLRALQLVPTN